VSYGKSPKHIYATSGRAINTTGLEKVDFGKKFFCVWVFKVFEKFLRLQVLWTNKT